MTRDPHIAAGRPRAGFTLIEMMISVVIMVTALAAAMTLAVRSNGSYRGVRLSSDAQQAARLGIEGLAQDIRMAGMGFNYGQLGVAPAGGSAHRVPAMWMGPNVNITDPGGQTIATSSIFMIMSNPNSVGIPAGGKGMQGVVVGVDLNTPLQVECVGNAGTAVDCSKCVNTVGGSIACAAGDNSALIPTSLAPLIIGDFHNAAYVTPNAALSAFPSSAPFQQTLTFVEQTSSQFSPNPKAPFGFGPGAFITQARVVHWYLWQPTPTTPPVLKRSYPVLATTAFASANCATTDVPFLDETNGGTAVGNVVSSAPVDSMQIAFTVDPGQTDIPTDFNVINTIGICDVTVPASVRAVRLQVVGRAMDTESPNGLPTAPQPILAQGGSAVSVGGSAGKWVYSTPQFEGVTPAAAGNGNYYDAYPRRATTLTVVPRTLQGARL